MNIAIRTLAIIASLVVLCAAMPAQAVYLDPPTWSPMTMLTVGFDGTNLTMQVQPDLTSKIGTPYPVLSPAPGTYDSVSGTYDLSVVTYDPAQPWAVLNGTAFSRRLGWYTAGGFYTVYAATLPADSFVWIEKIAGSPELQSYLAVGKYGVNADNTTTVDPAANGYSGIFGTAGSSTKWKWDGNMDHNTYAVDLADITESSQIFYATYTLYLGDADGNPLAGYGDVTVTWTWQGPVTAVPEPATLALLAAGAILAHRRKRL